MAADRHDAMTLDLLEWEPPALVSRYDDAEIRTATLPDRVARAVSATLRDAEADRPEIAAEMSAWLGEEVSKNMLDAYASQGREDHTVPFLRVLALIAATDDLRLLQLGAEMFGCSVIEDKWLPWVEAGQLADKRDELQKRLDATRRMARRGTGR